ncbi:MAG: hypothetical protein L6Q99_09930 [Planctomycetes bacterium]|nr:hypothetical protein [Planctomycetota bacterium]
MDSIARRAQPTRFDLAAIFIGVPVGLGALFVGSVLGCVMLKEAWSAWNLPATEVGAARLRSGDAALVFAPSAPQGPYAATYADFDGDGVQDRLEVRYHHVEEPFVSRSTSGLVLVTSGATDAVLLGYAVPTPFHDASWCGDVDGNGTADVFVEDLTPLVFGFVGKR